MKTLMQTIAGIAMLSLCQAQNLWGQDFQVVTGTTAPEIGFGVGHSPPSSFTDWPMVGTRVIPFFNWDGIIETADGGCDGKTYQYGTTTHNEIFKDATCGDNFLAVVGDAYLISTPTDRDIIFAFFNANGSVLYDDLEIGQNGTDVQERAERIREIAPLEFLVVGSTQAFNGNADFDILVMLITVTNTGPGTFSSAITWNTVVGANGDDMGMDGILASNGNLYITGSTVSMDINDGAGDIIIIEMNPANGAVTNSWIYGNDSNQYPFAIVEDQVNNMLVVTGSDVDGTYGGVDGFILVTDFNLALQNYTHFGGSGDDEPKDMTYASASSVRGIAIAGTTTSTPNSDMDGFIVKYEFSTASTPTLDFDARFGGSALDEIHGIDYDVNTDAFLMCGATLSFVINGVPADFYSVAVRGLGSSVYCNLNTWVSDQAVTINDAFELCNPPPSSFNTAALLNAVNVNPAFDQICGPACKAYNPTPPSGEPTKATLQIYPNPSNGSATISFTGDWKPEMQIYDAQGKLVLDTKVTGTDFQLQCGQLSTGLHLVMRETADGIVKTERLLIH